VLVPVLGFGVQQVARDWLFVAFVALLGFVVAFGIAVTRLLRWSRNQVQLAQETQQNQAWAFGLVNERPLPYRGSSLSLSFQRL
jgi:hypothetical protein